MSASGTAPAAASKSAAKTAKIRVLIADHLSSEGIQVLQSEPRLDVEIKTGLTPKDLAAIIEPFEGLVVRSATKVTAEVIAQAKHLKVIGRAGVGLDNVDVEAATKRGIVVMNVPAGNTISTAEHTWSLLMALARQIPQADAHMRAGKWERSQFVGVELYGKTLGIIGLGKIGAEVAKRGQAFGMRVIAHDPFLSAERAQQMEVSVVPLEQLWAEADFITVHTPLTAQTRHLISTRELSKMKQGVRLINCARGGIVDEGALLKALNDGHVAGAALDVYEEEPPKHHPFAALPQVVLTPHLGASTEEAQLNVAIDVAKQVVDMLLGRGVRNAVNMPSVDAQTLKVLEPYMRLGEKMGSLAAQLVGAPITEVRITYAGEMTAHDTSAVTLAMLKGILEPVVGENVNYVNASVIASERGVRLIEAKASQVEEFANLVALSVRSDGQHLEILGTLSARREPRIVKIDRYFVEVSPLGYLLVIKNEDQPGLIGQLGTLLGEAKVNIAGMSNGRDVPGGQAVTVVNVDSAVPEPVLAKIKTLTHVLDAKLIKL